MSKTFGKVLRAVIPFILVIAPFLIAFILTENAVLGFLTGGVGIILAAVYLFKLHRIEFNRNSKIQKSIFAFLILLAVIFSFLVAAVSIEDKWLHDYPFPDSVDNYGCYPQLFDAFQKGQLNIDTDYDLSIIAELENPYNPTARYKATGEKTGVFWDRAFFDGKLYCYFGAAPVVFLYYPAYFLTGKVLSDALSAAIMAAIASIFMMLILWELFARSDKKPPFALLLLGAATLPCGALLWNTVTCANFYHLAVQSGICATVAFFWLVLKAEARRDGLFRKLLFAAAGISVAAIVGSRPNLVLYVIIALPLLFSIIKKRPFGTKSLLLDIAAFVIPMAALGGVIMAYNAARFGSPFDFGANYQLTLTDASTYSLSSKLIVPAIYHFFLQPPLIDSEFPFIHPTARKMDDYGVSRYVYVARSVGAIFFPVSWGSVMAPLAFKDKKRKGIAALLALVAVIAIAIFDMCYGGIHLRYMADIMFVLTLLGAYLAIYTVASLKNGSAARVAAYTVVAMIFAATILIEMPLCFDNERDMILKYHRAFYEFIK